MTSEMLDRNRWYAHAESYWKRVDASVNGMLGGFAHVHQPDMTCSRQLLDELLLLTKQRNSTAPTIACDCGAGIGRISKGLLTHYFDKVDLVEVTEAFLQQARADQQLQSSGRVDRFIHSGLQSFHPESGRYDVIWCQWVLGHLTDEDLVAFLKRSLAAVEPKQGWVVVKENLASGTDDYILDEEDSSVTRSEQCWKRLFNQAGARIVREQMQTGFPSDLFKVKTFVIQIIS